MKLKSIFVIAAMLIVAISSCKKEDVNLPFNQLDQEANKQLVENSAITAAQTFDAMKDHSVIDASVSMGMKLEMSNPMDSQGGVKSKMTRTIEMLAGLDSDETDVNAIFSVMKSSGELASDAPESIQEAWDEAVGTYDWNGTTESWDYTANATAIVFNFPSTPDGTTNNATLTISNYTGVIVANNNLEGDYDGDFPASLEMEMTIDGDVVLTYIFAAQYNTDGIPESIASDLTMSPYKFSVDITNNDEEISGNYEFTNDNAIVMAISGGVNGDFTQENIDANTEVYTDTWEWTDYRWNDNTQQYEWVTVYETDEWEEVDYTEIAHSGTVKFQLYDISVGGVVDIKALGDAIDSIYYEDYYEDPNYDEETAVEMEAAAMNKHMHIYAIDEDTRKKIADVEAYVVVENYGEGYYDYWIDFRLVFGDGSLVDLETYFEEGFEDFVDEINGIITDLNSEYDWEIDPIEY